MNLNLVLVHVETNCQLVMKQLQVTLDGSNSDLSKFSISENKTEVPFLFF